MMNDDILNCARHVFCCLDISFAADARCPLLLRQIPQDTYNAYSLPQYLVRLRKHD